MPRRGQLVPLWDGQSGVDVGADPHTSPVWKQLSNVFSPRRGALEKRTGTDRSAAATATDTFVSPHGSMPVLSGGGTIAYYDVDNDTRRDAITDWPLLGVDTEAVWSLRAGTGGTSGIGEVYNGGTFWAVHAAVTGGLSELYTIDKSTGAVIDSATLHTGVGLSVGQSPHARTVRVANTNQCYYVNTGGYLARRSIDSAGVISSESATTLTVNVLTRQWLDVGVTSDGDAYVVYPSTSTVFRIARYVSGVGTPATVAAYTASTRLIAAACWPVDSDKVTVAWSVVNGGLCEVWVQIWDDTLTQVSTDVRAGQHFATTDDVEAVTGIALAGSFAGGNSLQSTVYYTSADDSVTWHVSHYDVGGTGTIPATGLSFVLAGLLAGKPAHLSGQSANDFILAIRERNDTRTHDIWITQDAQPIASVNRGTATGGTYHVRPIGPGAGTDDVSSALSLADVYEGTDVEAAVTIQALIIEQDPAIYVQDSEGAALISGALPTQLVRGQIYEQGWLTDPRTPAFNTNIVSGNMAIGSAYQIIVVWEAHDRLGRRSQSSPSGIYTHTPASSADQAISIKAYHVPVSLRDWSRVYAVVYRTVGNGTVHYRDVAIVVDRTSADNVITGIGLTSDTDLSVNEVLYTDLGLLDASPPPPHQVHALHQRRHFVAPSQHATSRIRYSREIVPAEVPQHNELLQLQVDSEGGPITALASHRDSLVVFKEARTIIYEGEGAADDGSGATFRRPYLVSSSDGARYAASVLRTPLGVIFEALDGIKLLDNSFRIVPIGDPVRYYVETYGPVVGAAAIADQGHAVFGFSAADAPLLVLDWLTGKWSTYQPPTNTISLCEHDGTLVRLDWSAYLWTDDRSSHDDNGAFVPTTLTTGWVSHGDRFRVKEILVKGYYRGAATLRIKVGYDRDAYWLDNEPFDPTVDLTAFDFGEHYGAGSASYEDQAFTLRFDNLSQQKCSSYRVEISDEVKSGNTAGFTITGVFALVSAKPGTKDLGDERRI